MEERRFIERLTGDCLKGISQLHKEKLVNSIAKETKLPPPVVTVKILEHLLHVVAFRDDFLAGRNTDQSFEILIENEKGLLEKGFPLGLITKIQEEFSKKSDHSNLEKVGRKISQLLEGGKEKCQH